jgi:5-methylcytosine-specific restriction endonuclease McrBC regulatory subunit McrC
VKEGETILQSKSIFLDALVQGPRRLVLDAKWKEGIVAYARPERDSDVLHLEGLHIRNVDLFQVIAYGMHQDVQAQGGVLVYPVLESETVCRQRCILDFGGNHSFPVYLVGMPVGETLRQAIDDFVGAIKRISGAVDEDIQ